MVLRSGVDERSEVVVDFDDKVEVVVGKRAKGRLEGAEILKRYESVWKREKNIF